MTAQQNSGFFDELNRLERLLLKDNVKLTQRELEVLYWAVETLDNAEIALKCGISVSTVKTHKNNLIDKLPVQGKSGFHKYLLKLSKNQP
ncbi:MAG: helix-turn-helix transcriptional regulator [Bacteroidetes bacterium]|nr:helix-turn-helix transcriptional regulator [Bacteroidota bacterium]